MDRPTQIHIRKRERRRARLKKEVSEAEFLCGTTIWKANIISTKRMRVGLKYDDSEFIWGNIERQPETRPEEKQKAGLAEKSNINSNPGPKK